MSKRVHYDYTASATTVTHISNKAACAVRVAGRRTYVVTGDQAQVNCSRCRRWLDAVGATAAGKVVDLMEALKSSLAVRRVSGAE